MITKAVSRSDRVTWKHLIAIQPELLRLEKRIKAVKDDRFALSFCANRYCKDELEPQVNGLVGWHCRSEHEFMKESRTWQVAFNHLYHLLPGCRNCLCINFMYESPTWSNKEWKVGNVGMTRRDEDAYHIHGDRYNEIIEDLPWCSYWIDLAATKDWWSFTGFLDAFEQAFRIPGMRPRFDWKRSVQHVRECRGEMQEGR